MSEKALTLKESGVRWLLLALIIFITDIAIKLFVMDNMWLRQSIEVLPFFNITYAHNYGAAFSFLSDQPGWQRWFFTSIAFVVTAMLTYWMSKLPAKEKWNNIAYAMIIGGAIGNVFDRIVHGYVVDYLHFYIGQYHWPVFNLADTTICIGAAMIILDGFLSKEKTTA
ncbi:signal peptidase II [Vibrio rhodolitus]|uniref:signal peptidase II n=1 Tax=Vibrio rhodolitus TaxID=2231649 RepID=UPI000E0C9E9B|nr:signal peptidase II [Vibrio rhodolitus]